jgi:hypothetical protein
MFLLYAIAIGLALGALTGGHMEGLAALRFRWAPLAIVGFAAQVVLFAAPVSDRVGDAGPPLYVASTLLVLAAVARNMRLPGLPIVVLGAVSNLVAIVANGGYMPASPAAIEALGRHAATTYSNSAIVANPALAPLTDQYALPGWLPLANVFSIGDALIALGVAVAIAMAMRTAAVGPRVGAGGNLPQRTDLA